MFIWVIPSFDEMMPGGRVLTMLQMPCTALCLVSTQIRGRQNAYNFCDDIDDRELNWPQSLTKIYILEGKIGVILVVVIIKIDN
jgi:hypothetical protein